MATPGDTVAMTHTIYFSGQLLPGHQKPEVAQRMQDKMRLSAQQVERLFSGQRVAIKRDLDASQAKRFLDGLAALGALAQCEPPLPTGPASALTLSPPADAPAQPAAHPASDDPYAKPVDVTQSSVQQCVRCGTLMPPQALRCHVCGTDQRPGVAKRAGIAALLAVLFGWLGGHRLYLGQWWGVLYLLIFPLGWVISLVEAAVFMLTPAPRWQRKYGDVRGSSSMVAVLIAGPVLLVIVGGIMAAVAIPAYNDYIMRAEVSYAIDEAQPYRDKVEALMLRTGFTPGGNIDAGIPANVSDKHLASLNIKESGAMVITFTHAQLDNQTMVWQPILEQQQITWDCTGGSLPNRYRPTRCRNSGDTTAQAPGAATDAHTYYSADRIDSLELGSDWQPLDIGGATMSYIHYRDDIGIAVQREAREDFEPGMTLDEYKQLLIDYTFTDFSDVSITDMGYRELNGLPALMFTVTGYTGGIKVKALVAAVESSDNFYKVTSWSSRYNFDQREQQIEQLVTSFRTTNP
ncbi:MAG: pilin [Alcanivoracaceae bacterium]|nr:pilin [Alcanivoracaceae bacterium]